MATKPPAYKVGYRKPPEEHRFKKGQSGNKAGRPKRSRNVSTVLAEQLDKPLQVRVGDKTMVLPARTVLMWRLVEKGALGNLKAIEMAFKYEISRIAAEVDGNERDVGGVLVVPEAMITEMWEQRALEHREKQRREAEKRALEAGQAKK
jgi:hypothetical protein